ncbi:MAG: hypothetical protein JXJ04_02835 [Spirochaetales bacterium]|nr:hypothetical protein [Spirochaetales bacterium]
MSEISELREEVYPVLLAEAQRRTLSQDIIDIVRSHSRHLSEYQFTELVTAYRQRPCPVCGKSEFLINALHLIIKNWYILFSVKKEKFILACKKCILQQLPQTLEFRTQIIKIEKDEPTPELLDYIRQNRGKIEKQLQSLS